jgi:hypothetical protein
MRREAEGRAATATGQRLREQREVVGDVWREGEGENSRREQGTAGSSSQRPLLCVEEEAAARGYHCAASVTGDGDREKPSSY